MGILNGVTQNAEEEKKVKSTRATGNTTSEIKIKSGNVSLKLKF